MTVPAQGRRAAFVLVAYATGRGSTRGVAERIAARLEAAGLRVEIRDLGTGDALGDPDAVVLGSPVYGQRWLPEAEAFVERNRTGLTARPLWLFSVGTFGDDRRLIGPLMRREPRGIGDLTTSLGARGYRVFAGVIDRDAWPPLSRLLFHAFGGRLGDNRDWARIEAWADEIAGGLAPVT